MLKTFNVVPLVSRNPKSAVVKRYFIFKGAPEDIYLQEQVKVGEYRCWTAWSGNESWTLYLNEEKSVEFRYEYLTCFEALSEDFQWEWKSWEEFREMVSQVSPIPNKV